MALHRRPSRKVVLLLILSGALVFAEFVIVPSVRVEIRRAGTANRLQHIEAAMQCYHQIYRHFSMSIGFFYPALAWCNVRVVSKRL